MHAAARQHACMEQDGPALVLLALLADFRTVHMLATVDQTWSRQISFVYIYVAMYKP